MKKENKKGLILNLAKKMGDNSVNAACMLWYHQPKVPNSMKKESKEK